MTPAAITLVLSLVAFVFAVLTLLCGAEHLDRRSLRRQRRCSWCVTVSALFMLVFGPVAALTIVPVHGAHLTVVMAHGLINLAVLAIHVTVLHQVKAAEKALP